MTSTATQQNLINTKEARAWAEYRRNPHFSGLTMFFQKIWFVFAGLALYVAIENGPSVTIPLVVLMLCALFTYLQHGTPISAIGLIFVFPVILVADWLGLSRPRKGHETQVRGVRYDPRTHMLWYRERAGKNVSIGVENVFELMLDPENSRPIIHVYREGRLFPAHVSNKRCSQLQIDQLKADLEGWRKIAMKEWFAQFGPQTKALFESY
mgnify:CR=1 FL=1|tara:strand:+ start:756 stop:1385 length:630 start_codon:yes stop_codon:yes gene_type:complete